MSNPFKNITVASRTGIMLGIPTLGRPVSLAWASAYKSLVPAINFNMVVCQINGAPVAEARNAIVREALKIDAKYIFFLGDDVVVPPHTLRQLITRLENNSHIGVVGAVYCSKSNPPAPLVFRGNGEGSFWDWRVGEFFEVTGLGMDATLIRTDLFKELPDPWFKTVDETEFENGINKASQYTEDLWFLKNVVEKTESRIYCDASLICTHEDVLGGKTYTLPPGSLPLRKATTGNISVVDIGCGPLHKEYKGHKAIRVDIREDVEPDYVCDVRNLPFADQSFDVVMSSHVLEHFPRKDFRDVLGEWLRIVAKEGQIILDLPNIAWAANRMINEHIIDNDVLNVLYGAQSYAQDFHYNGLTPEIMDEALAAEGFFVESTVFHGYNMHIVAKRKP